MVANFLINHIQSLLQVLNLQRFSFTSIFKIDRKYLI